MKKFLKKIKSATPVNTHIKKKKKKAKQPYCRYGESFSGLDRIPI